MRKYKNFCSFHLCLTTIRKISLTQYRNYSSGSFSFNASVTCITGPNGSGKTNLLDAVYYLCYTKSYFTSYQQYTAQSGTDGFRVDGFFVKDGTDTNVICKWKQGKKEVMADNTVYESVSDHIGKYSAVMIAPDDIELINDGSEIRRRFVDGILSQADKRYFESLMQYQKVLQQRNAWLKQQFLHPSSDSASLEYYDQQLVLTGSYIHQKRREFLSGFMPFVDQFYHKLCEGKEMIRVAYESELSQKPLQQLLRESLQHDMRTQRTNKGIHKDDLVFLLDEILIKQFGSQGQKKSYLFALKLAQYAYLSQQLGYLPILLLDDIFEKLDQNRMEALLKIIRGEGFGQVLLTDTHQERVQKAFGEGAEIEFIKL